jgi:gliding motility-associated-like protein
VTQTSATGGIAAGFYQATLTTVNGCSATAGFSINPVPSSVSFSVPGPYIINCYNPTLNITLVPATYNYFWASPTKTVTGPFASFTANNQGSVVVTGTDVVSGCVGTQTFNITVDQALPSSTITPLTQNITCSLTSAITLTAYGSPSVNVQHIWISPLGGTLTTLGQVSLYSSTNLFPGVFTHSFINVVNGCSVTKTFTVTSSSGFPTYSLTSPQNFTLGCSTKSIATINITNGQTTPVGGPVSYTLLAPGATTPYATGSQSSYTNITVPGNYTAVVKDNTNFCETRVQFSVLQNIFPPDLSVIAPRTTLDCDHPSALLQGISVTPNVSYDWLFQAVPGNLPSDSIRVKITSSPNNSVVGNYTLVIVDNNNACRSSSVITILQNIYTPDVKFSGAMPITCKTPTVNLTNISSTKVPPQFNPTGAVYAQIWYGPSPQEPKQLSTTYIAAVPGVYTLVAKDSNNGCIGTYTAMVDDFRDYPVVNNPVNPGPFVYDCASNGATIYPIVTGLVKDLVYEWEAVPSTSFTSLFTATTVVNNTGHFDVTVTNTLNGCQANGFLEVISGTLNAAFSAEPVSGFAPLNVSFTNLSSSTATLSGNKNILNAWSYGNGQQLSFVSASVNPSTVYSQAGTYTVTLFARKGDCNDTAKMVIRVELPSKLEIPNVFTPNGDGKNDEFFVRSNNLVEISAEITDRWGHLVYKVTSASGNILWDGLNQTGQPVSEGVYLYVIRASGKDGQEYDEHGTVTLIR